MDVGLWTMDLGLWTLDGVYWHKITALKQNLGQEVPVLLKMALLSPTRRQK